MSKQPRTGKASIPSRKNKSEKTFWNSFDFLNILPSKYVTMLSIGIIIILFFMFFSPVFFQGKSFISGDIVTIHTYETAREVFKGETLWNPYIFTGLPSQFSGVGYDRWFDLIGKTYITIREVWANIFNNTFAEYIFFVIVMSITTYAFMRFKKATHLVALYSAAAIGFSTGLIVFIFIGHITKLYSLSMFPLVLMMLLKFREKIKLLDFVILVVAFNFMLSGWHIQIIFYIFFSMLIFYIFYFFKSLKDKPAVIQLLKSAGVVLIALIIAFGMSFDLYAQMYEYSEISTRGEKSVVEKSAGQEEVKGEGSAFYNYATDWSFSPGEVGTFLIPSLYGFGNSTYNGPLTQERDVEVNTYFGQMRFVDVAMYMGVLVFVLALFAMFAYRKDSFVQYLIVLFIISLLISFGRNFSPVFDLMFYNFPFFDKFRVPSMILTLIQLISPLLAGLGIKYIIDLRESTNQKAKDIIKYLAYAFTAILVLSVLLSSPLKGWMEERLIAAKGEQLSPLKEYVSDMFMGDLLIAFAILAASFWLAVLYIREKVSRDIFVAALIIFTVFDLFRISGRGANYVEKSEIENIFNEPSYISYIKSQKDSEPFRMLNLRNEQYKTSINSNYHMYFLVQDFGGYSGIKPRAYQDYLDIVTYANPTLWNMANIKYLVMDNFYNMGPGVELVYADTLNKNIVFENKNVMPRAYFVNSVQKMPELQFLESVKANQFNPKETANVQEDIKVDPIDSTAFVNITKYESDVIEIDAKAVGNNFLVLSDTYYDKGWKAYIDGKETKMYRANHLFRGIIVPEGNHKIKFEFIPESYTTGKTVSLSLNILLLIGFGVGLFFIYKKKNKPEDVAKEDNQK